MVTIAKIYESMAQYDRDNYYLRDEDGSKLLPELVGNGWQQLKAQDIEITEDAYKNLKDGKDPVTGDQVVSTNTKGEHRPGYNFTFSPHKSFTVLANTNPEYNKLIDNIHEKAVADTLNILEKDLIQARQSVDGVVAPVRTNSLLAMKVNHQINRDGDVQLHSHVVAFNMTYNKDSDKWQALHSDAFHSDLLTIAYNNQLAKYAKDAGLAVEFVKSDSGRTQYATIAGVPENAVEATSARAKEIDDYLVNHRAELAEKYPNANKGELKQYAAYATRPSKKAMTQENIKEQFEERLSTKGLTQDDIVNSVKAEISKVQDYTAGKGKEQARPLNAGDLIDKAAKSLTDTKSVFSQQELLKEALLISHGDFNLNDLKLAMTTGGSNSKLVNVANNHIVHDKNRSYASDIYTTRDILKTERQSIDTVLKGRDTVGAYADKAEVAEIINAKDKTSKYPMTEGQKKTLEHILTSQDKYTFVQGFAGTGKTTVMESLKDAAQSKDVNIIGISETNSAVIEMRESLGNAETVTKFMHSKHDLNDRSLILVDESSFVGTKNFQKILDVAEKTGARVSFWGDKDQLPAVAAGTPFCRLVGENKVKYAEMKDIVRQENTHYKEAVYDIIDRKVSSALSKVEVIENERVATMLTTPGGKDGGYTHSKADFDVLMNKLNDSNYFYKDGLNKLFEDEKTARSALKQAVMGGWLTITARQESGKTYYSYDKTQYFGKDFNEIKNEAKQLREEAGKAAYGDLVKSYIDKGYKDTIVSTYTNEMRESFNGMARNSLKEGGILRGDDIKVSVFVDKNVQGANRFLATSYNKGDKFLIQKSGAGVKMGAELIVKDVDKRNNLIHAVNGKGEIKSLDMRQHGDKVSAFESREINITTGEKILFNKTVKKDGIINSDIGVIKEIEKDKNGALTSITAIVGKREVKIDPRKYNHFEHGYAVTTYAAQGKTGKNAITLEGRAFQDFYVGASRGKQNLTVFVLDKDQFLKNASKDMIKEMAQDYTGEAKDPKATGKVLANLQKELNTIDREIQWKTENKELGKDAGQNDKITKRRGIANKIDELNGRLQQWKKKRTYKKHASKLSKKHQKELMQKPTEKDLKKATGLKSVILDSKSGLNFVKTEAGYLQAWKNRAGDNLKKSITKHQYKTRVYDIYRKDKNGNLIRAKQVTSYKMDSKGNGRFESLTFYPNGNIDRFSENYVRGEKSMSRTEKIIKPDSLKNQFKSLENSKSQRTENENIARGESENFKTVGAKNEIVKDANIKKSEHQFPKNEKSEFENDIYRESKFSKSHEGEVENLKSEGRNFEKSNIEK